MALIDWDDVAALAPELDDFDETGQGLILDYVNVALDVSIFGGEESPKLRLARIFLAAHFATVSKQGGVGAAGPVISESAGGLSRSYALLSASSSGFSGSSYGDQYLALIRSTVARAPVVL
jgi:hypothetical protein